MEFKHVPVLLEECMQALNLKDDAIYFDGTLGGGGHSQQILKRTNNARLIATDLDEEAIAVSKQRLKEYEERFTPVHANFKNFSSIMKDLSIDKIDGALLDLGVSSYQLDERERGFSYMAENEKLDMRMNRESVLSAYEVVNKYKEERIVEILFEYGEEKFARRIARGIIETRKNKPIETCKQLVEIIEKAIPGKFMNGGHPAKRTFQAIRIEVNGELDKLDEAVKDIVKGLKVGGRLAVITFHSLEDRIVKNAFKELYLDCICPKNLPYCVCGKRREIEFITKKPIIAGSEEAKLNPRSLSAKLRVVERI